ncbi:hypothetical protein C8Q80DRAFT_1271302 [Daedaleopsis nitida]|nr:hypothetical protein C8Q80DRAFT_1271302 [Daedaleopsis nitida]
MSLRSTLSASSHLRRPQRSHAVTRHFSLQRSPDGPAAVLNDELALPSALLRSVGSSNPGGPDARPDGPGELSDQEWEIRTGRAIYVLQQTLPTFFTTGLISSVDTSGSNSRVKEDNEISIYSPNIRLEYRPPTPFPPPFPRTLHVEGLPLYLASSSFVRHTLNALYTDLRVELERVRVHGPRSSGTRADSPDGPDPQSPDDSPPGPERTPQSRTRSIREKSLFVGLTVHGTNRVSKVDGGWQVNSTYTFSPVTGLIHIHNIDSIHPAPHQAFFNALQAALSKIGLGGPEGAAGAGSVARTLPRAQAESVPSVPHRS